MKLTNKQVALASALADAKQAQHGAQMYFATLPNDGDSAGAYMAWCDSLVNLSEAIRSYQTEGSRVNLARGLAMHREVDRHCSLTQLTHTQGN